MQPDLFSAEGKRGAAPWTGDLRRAAEVCARWQADFCDYADQGRQTASVPLSEIAAVSVAVSRLVEPKADGGDPADPIAFLESWLEGGRAGGAVAPKILTPGQGRALLDGIRARLAAAGAT